MNRRAGTTARDSECARSNRTQPYAVRSLAALLLGLWQKALLLSRIFGSAGALLRERLLAVLLVLGDRFF